MQKMPSLSKKEAKTTKNGKKIPYKGKSHHMRQRGGLKVRRKAPSIGDLR